MVDTHVSEADAFTLQLERDPLLRSTIVAIARFDRSPDWPRLVERIDRATRIDPNFRKKLATSPMRLAPPRWVTDPDFDLSWHLRRSRVPAGAGFEAVLEVARIAGMDAFDHDRPLWEFTLVEGLPDGEAALVMKIHHSLTDGIGGISLAGNVVDLSREPDELPEVAEPALDPPSRQFEPLLEALTHDVRYLVGGGADLLRRAPAVAISAARHPRRSVREFTAVTASIARFVQPVMTTKSPLMRERRLLWHFDTLDVPVAGLKAAAATVEGTLNDAYVAAIGGGFRRYHDHHGAIIEDLRVSMPISLRTDEDGIGGNRITIVRFTVPVRLGTPAERIYRIGELCRSARHEPALSYGNWIAGVLNLLPVAVPGGMFKHVDLLASNVPGFPVEVFVAGARVEAFYPFGPPLGSSANITLVSYDGMCNIGINTDGGAVPDPDVLKECLREGFDEVLALAGG